MEDCHAKLIHLKHLKKQYEAKLDMKYHQLESLMNKYFEDAKGVTNGKTIIINFTKTIINALLVQEKQKSTQMPSQNLFHVLL